MQGWMSLFRQGKDTWSSKRFFGGIGLMLIHFCYVYRCIEGGEITSDTAILAGLDATLLGADTVADAIKKRDEG